MTGLSGDIFTPTDIEFKYGLLLLDIAEVESAIEEGATSIETTLDGKSYSMTVGDLLACPTQDGKILWRADL